MDTTRYAARMIRLIESAMSKLDTATRGPSLFDPARDAHSFFIGAVDYFDFMFMPVLTARFKTIAPN
ncbi:LysR family transcriptional regulator, partial [Kosakonia cowanii]